MEIDLIQISLSITAVLLVVSSAALVLAARRAIKIRNINGLEDFRVQMAIVAWIWLSGEVVELIVREEPGTSLHIASMIMFSAFIIWRTKSYLI